MSPVTGHTARKSRRFTRAGFGRWLKAAPKCLKRGRCPVAHYTGYTVGYLFWLDGKKQPKWVQDFVSAFDEKYGNVWTTIRKRDSDPLTYPSAFARKVFESLTDEKAAQS